MNIFTVLAVIVALLLINKGIIAPKKNRTNETPTVVSLKTPIDLRYKYVKRAFKSHKIVPTSLKEQKKIKKAFLKIYPDNLFYDELNEKNSITTEEAPVAQSMLDRPIDLRHIYKNTLWGSRTQAVASASEQRQIKKCILMVFPDNMFYDQLHESNSVKIKKRRGSTSRDDGYFMDYDDFVSDGDYDSDGDFDPGGGADDD